MAANSAIGLDEFIEATVNEIIEGVDALRNKHADRVAPPCAATVKIEGQQEVASHDGSFWTVISFDVAVTASKETQTEVGGSLGAKLKVFVVASVSGKLQGSVSESGMFEVVHRVKFAIPIRLSEKTE